MNAVITRRPSILVPSRRVESLSDELERVVGAISGYDAAGLAKYGEPYLIAELAKRAMRIGYVSALTRTRGEPRERFLKRSRAFWEEYEEINRRWLPEDPVYTGTRGGVTLATANDLWTLTSPASGQARVLESYIGGESTVSTVLRFKLQRSTTGTTATNQTPEKMNSRSAAASSTFATGWSVQPSLTGSVLIWHAFTTFGGTDRWVPSPGEEIYLVNGELLSGRSDAGTPVVSAHLIWEEL